MFKACSNKLCSNPAKDSNGLLPATTQYFRKDGGCKFDLSPRCKICRAIQDRESYIRYRDKRLAKMKQYREANREKVALAKKNCYLKKQQYYIDKAQTWVVTHRERSRVSKMRREKERLATDINFRLVYLLRRRLNKAVKGLAKADTTMNLVGCSIEQLRVHIENTFQSGMSWENQGYWHIDHIKPCKLFNFSKPEEQKACFHYSNLQALWATDNLKKQAKYLE